MKIVFMGTPDFAVNALEELIRAKYEILCVVTQPDKPKGRGKQLQLSAVKECALKHGLPVFQPVKVKEREAVEYLKELKADIFVVAAFGQILSKEILELPTYGCINIHGSLLPKYRGAAPIQWAILNGEKETGITIMQMNEGLDTGDMLTKCIVPIEDNDTGETLFDKMADSGAKLLLETLPLIKEGKITAIRQKEEESSYAPMIKKEMGRIDWHQEAKKIELLIRGMNSWPSAYTTMGGKTLKVWEAVVEEENSSLTPGTIVKVTKDTIKVQTGNGILGLKAVQPEGKKRMEVSAFLLGNTVEEGSKLG
ncbi:MAG: methionyl-tRNA formyltransferase [Lachnospiraceae bacterium]|nr:methionyl-tRNA formyltransferase [Lachnospiraceae bacterium]